MIHWDANLFHFNYKIICKYPSKISEHIFFFEETSVWTFEFSGNSIKKEDNSQYLSYISSFHLLNKKPLLEIEELR